MFVAKKRQKSEGKKKEGKQEDGERRKEGS